MIDLSTLIILVAFPILRCLDGCDKIPRWVMCFGMAIAVTISNGNWHILALFPALLWAYSFGWSLSAINGIQPRVDWDLKFAPSGDFIDAFFKKTLWIERIIGKEPYQKVLGAVGWPPRIFMTFWLPCAVAGNVWAVMPLALLWGWCYWIGGAIGRLINRDIGARIGEGLTAIMLAVALVYS